MFSGGGSKVLLFGIGTGIGNRFRFLDVRLAPESGFLHTIKKVVPQNPIEPCLAILNFLTTVAGDEVAEKYFLQGVLSHFAISYQPLSKAKKSGGILLIKIDDLGFEGVEGSFRCYGSLTERMV